MTHHPNPYWLRDPQVWAIEQERTRHAQALYMVGEYAFFCLMWHQEDFDNGLVGRCGRCYGQFGKVAEVYSQPSQNNCPDCYGTTYEGGFRCLIVRPAIFDDTDEGEDRSNRGVIHSDDVNVETTWDFRVRTFDYCFRQDGSRWQLRVPARTTLRTGFQPPQQDVAAITYNNMRAQLEDPSSVAYQIGYSAAQVKTILNGARFTPSDFTNYEILRGPLIPKALES